jgi:hypothetical protein
VSSPVGAGAGTASGSGWARRAYTPPRARSSWCVPVSTRRPWSPGEAARGEQEQGREDEGGQRQVPAQPEGGGGMEDGGERGRDRAHDAGDHQLFDGLDVSGEPLDQVAPAVLLEDVRRQVLDVAEGGRAQSQHESPGGPGGQGISQTADQRGNNHAGDDHAEPFTVPAGQRPEPAEGLSASPSIDDSFPQPWTDAPPARRRPCSALVSDRPALRRVPGPLLRRRLLPLRSGLAVLLDRGEPVERHGDSPFPVIRVGEFQHGKHHGIRRPRKGNSGETSIKERRA